MLIALMLAAWQLLFWTVGDAALRSPAQTLRYTGTLLAGEMLWPHMLETMTAFALALALAIIVGLAIGFTLGSNKFAGEVFEPMLVAIYSIPKITLYPILLLMFGLGMSAKVAFGTIHGVIPIAIFTINAVRNVRPVLIKHGWKLDQPGENEKWTRPGKDAGTSATLKDGVFFVHTSSFPPLAAGKGYSQFQVFAILEHGGDFCKAAAALRPRSTWWRRPR